MKTSNPWGPLEKGIERKRNPTAFVISQLINGNLKILPLLSCKPKLFEAAKKEAMNLTWQDGRKHSTWHIPKMSFRQFNLYSRGDDTEQFIEELDVWKPGRQFLPSLSAIPELLKFYFGDSEMQNCRILTVNHFGELTAHREPIINIPGRPNHYKLRFHIPLSTSTKVKFFMDSTDYTMKERTLFLYNQSCSHGVKNVINIQRSHLVFDYFLNEKIITDLIIPKLQPSWEK